LLLKSGLGLEIGQDERDTDQGCREDPLDRLIENTDPKQNACVYFPLSIKKNTNNLDLVKIDDAI